MHLNREDVETFSVGDCAWAFSCFFELYVFLHGIDDERKLQWAFFLSIQL